MSSGASPQYKAYSIPSAYPAHRYLWSVQELFIKGGFDLSGKGRIFHTIFFPAKSAAVFCKNGGIHIKINPKK